MLYTNSDNYLDIPYSTILLKYFKIFKFFCLQDSLNNAYYINPCKMCTNYQRIIGHF
jgi:hypothetical protein